MKGTPPDGTLPDGAGTSTATTVARWLAAIVAVAAVSFIVVGLVRPAETEVRSLRIVLGTAFLVHSWSVFTKHERGKLVLGLIAAILILAAIGLFMLSSC